MPQPLIKTFDESRWPWSIPTPAEVEQLITEDETPVDSLFSEKQQRLLTESLYLAWQPDKPFVAMANVGLFYAAKQPPLVPDALVSLDVTPPADVWPKKHRSYMVWEYGKPPDVVVEVVSNREGGEDSRKLRDYAKIGVKYYLIFDPEQHLGNRLLRIYRLVQGRYVETVTRIWPGMDLGVTLWEGTYADLHTQWLRWCYPNRELIPTGAEKSAAEFHRAEQEQQRAEQERLRAEQERTRAERLAAKLRALGIDADEV